MKRLNLFFICVLPAMCAMAQRGGTELPGGMEELLHGTYVTCINVEKAGTLASLLTQEQKDTCSHLKITGRINSADIITFRKMAGEGGRLETIDLSEARIVSSKEPYLVVENAEKRVFIKPQPENGTWAKTPAGWSRISLNDSYRSRDVRFGTPDLDPYRGLNRGGATPYLPPYREMTHSSRDGNAYSYLGRNAPYYITPPVIYLYDSDVEGVPGVKSKNLRSTLVKGHRIKREGEGFLLSAHSARNTFCRDMFYLCPKLKTVIVPAQAFRNDHVSVVESNIQFVEVQMP